MINQCYAQLGKLSLCFGNLLDKVYQIKIDLISITDVLDEQALLLQQFVLNMSVYSKQFDFLYHHPELISSYCF